MLDIICDKIDRYVGMFLNVVCHIFCMVASVSIKYASYALVVLLVGSLLFSLYLFGDLLSQTFVGG